MHTILLLHHVIIGQGVFSRTPQNTGTSIKNYLCKYTCTLILEQSFHQYIQIDLLLNMTRRFLYDQLIYSTNPFRLTLVLNTAFGRWSIIAPHSVVICYFLTIIFTILNADVLIWYVSTCKAQICL